MILVLDTSIWIAILLPADKFHIRAKSWMESCPPNVELTCPQLSLVEIASTLARQKKSRTYILRCLELVHQMIQLPPECHLYYENCIEAAVNCKCRGADSIFIGLCDYLRADLCTLDQEQQLKSQKMVKCHVLK